MHRGIISICLLLATASANAVVMVPMANPGVDQGISPDSIQCGFTNPRIADRPAYVVIRGSERIFARGLRSSPLTAKTRLQMQLLSRQCHLAISSAYLGHPKPTLRADRRTGEVTTSDGRYAFDPEKIHCAEGKITWNRRAPVLVDDAGRVVFKPIPNFTRAFRAFAEDLPEGPGRNRVNGYSYAQFDALDNAIDRCEKTLAEFRERKQKVSIDPNAYSLIAPGAITAAEPEVQSASAAAPGAST